MKQQTQLPPLQQLKIATQAAHNATEAIAFAKEIGNKTLTIEQYQRLLYGNLYIHEALEKSFEQAIAQLPTQPFSHFYSKKSDWLQMDIAALSTDNLLEKKYTISPPSFTSIAALTGGLYVVEGAMLGGQYIVKQLRQQQNEIADISTFYFFRGYGTATGKRWQEFREKATSILLQPADIQTAIKSALATFSFFYSVYAKI